MGKRRSFGSLRHFNHFNHCQRLWRQLDSRDTVIPGVDQSTVGSPLRPALVDEYLSFSDAVVTFLGVRAYLRSLEFTVTRSLMKLFQTSSATIIQDCQKFFHLLPVSYMIDIRTAKFLENFIINDNYVCRLFAHIAKCSLDKKILSYGVDIFSSFSSSDMYCFWQVFVWCHHIWHCLMFGLLLS